jgi:hypothetical protein
MTRMMIEILRVAPAALAAALAAWLLPIIVRPKLA